MTEHDEISLEPDGSVLLAYANAPHKWVTVLGEWIDNALDADARTVAIEFTSQGSIRVSDDGRGCEDLTNMIRLGRHQKQRTTKLGRYGIGGKEAALWVGGPTLNSLTRIESVHRGVRRTLEVNWLEFSQRWTLPKSALTQDAARPHEDGTIILVQPCRKPRHGRDWQDLLSELGYLYSPAIKLGRQIKLKRNTRGATWEPLVRWELPKFVGEIVDERIVVGGRGARVYCGVVEGANPRSGFTYVHEWRVVQAASAAGCGSYGMAHVCGFVELDATWSLTKNKDGVSSHADELYAEVERVALPVLKRAEQVGASLQSDRFISELNQRFCALLSTRAKAKRERPDVPIDAGAKEPTGEGGPHTQAEREQVGDRFNARERGSGGFRIEPFRAGVEDSIGGVKPPHVLLNLDNPKINELWQSGNSDAIVALALSLLVVHNSYAPNGQPCLKGFDQDTSPEGFSRAIGTILSRTLCVDGRPMLRLARRPA